MNLHKGAAAGRKLFRVIADGVASDGTRYQGTPVEFYSSKKLELNEGTIFSADIPPDTNIDSSSIFVESVRDEAGNDVPVS